MSKAVKTIVAIAVSVAIPFVAPSIAATIGLSGAIGATAGSAVVGAGLGAINAAATGGDVGRGALMGGIGGGITGYNYTPTPTGAELMGPPAAAQPLGTSFDQYLAAPTAAAPAGLDISTMGPPTSAPPLGNEFNTFAAAPTASFTPQTTVNEVGQIVSATPAAPTASFTPQTTVNEVGQIVSATPAAAAPAVAAMGPPAAAQPLGAGFDQYIAAPKTFAEAVRAVPGTIAAKFSDPKALADLTLRAAGSIAGSLAAGDGMSDQEKQLLQAQTAELRSLQQSNKALFDQKLQAAQDLIGESKYFDPEYFGLQRARRAQLAGAKAKQAGLRGLTGSRRASEERRLDLATGRDTGTAFDQGYGAGVQGRLQTMQAGLTAMPAYPSADTGFSNLRAAYDAADTRNRRARTDFAKLYGSFTGAPTAS